jgi:hypothetical protein
VISAYLYQGPIKKWQEKSNKPINPLSGIDINLIDKIEISNLKLTTKLIKTGDNWKIDGTKDFFVKKEVADEMIATLKDAEKSDLELISTNKEKQAEFMTDSQNGLKIKLFTKDKERSSLIIGKPGPDYMSNYLTKSGENSTYLVKILLANVFSREDWRDDTIFSSDKAKITSIRLQYPNRVILIEKKNDKWEAVKPNKFSIKEDKVNPILDIMANLNSNSWPEQSFKGTDLEKNLIIAEAKGEGIQNILMVGKNNGKGQFFAKKGDNDHIYLITKEQKSLLDKKLSDFK